MSLAHVFECVEDAMTKLGVVDLYGEPCIGLEAFGLINAASPATWTDLENKLERGEITAEQYREGALNLVKQVARDRFRRQLNLKLARLRQDQVELDIGAVSPEKKDPPMTQDRLF